MLKNPLLSRFLIFIFLPLVTIIGWFSYIGLSSIPPANDSVNVNGINKPVEVLRDKWGVVFIDAQSDVDAFFTMGYMQAQDRLWQLEVQKRMASGRLSEVFGKSMVEQDVFMRSLGLYAAADKALNSLSPDVKLALTSYAAGINAWIAQGAELPPEFLMFDIKPKKWKEVDSLAWIKVFALNLGGNYLDELEHYAASQVLKKEQLYSLYPELADIEQQAELAGLHVNSNYVSLVGELVDKQKEQLQIGGKHVGSNAWVVSGKRTKNGSTILANDPHLGLQIPSYWYFANLKGDKIDTKGAALVGLPIILFGRNEHIAWGGTNLGADAQDLFVEQINVNNTNEYRVNDEWQTITERMETIIVKQDFPAAMNKPLKPLKIKVRSTRNGPIISDVYGLVENPVALKWTALEDQDTSFEAFYDLNYAQQWGDFKLASSKLVAPALNLLYADKSGDIGLIAAGKIPIRKKGKGLLPVVGWTDAYQWQDYIPGNELPMIYNPPSGYIVSANDKAFDKNYPYFVSAKWAPKARAVRISQLLNKTLQAKGHIGMQDHADIQGDVTDLAITEILPVLKNVKCETDIQCEAVDIINGWDGLMSQTLVAPTIITVWLDHLRQTLMADDLQAPYKKGQLATFLSRVIGNLTIQQMLSMLNNPNDIWCKDKLSAGQVDCNKVLLSSLDGAIEEISKLAGSDMTDWKWGEWHHTVYKHQPISQIKLLKGIFERGIENGGSVNSVNVANASYRPSEGYEQSFGAGFRQIMSLNEVPGEHWFMNSTGQSGHVLSSHYDDMVEPFNKLEFANLPWNLDDSSRKISLFPTSD